MTSCEQMNRWLDEGMPELGRREAMMHAASCAECAASLAAALELDQLLASAVLPAPAGLTRQVMARIDAAEAARRTAPQAPPGLRELDAAPTPWWIRAAADPAAALAFVVAGLVMWKKSAIVAAALAAATWISAGAGGLAGRGAGPDAGGVAALANLAAIMTRPELMLGLTLALAPAVAWLSWRLWNWAESRAGC